MSSQIQVVKARIELDANREKSREQTRQRRRQEMIRDAWWRGHPDDPLWACFEAFDRAAQSVGRLLE